MNSLIPDLTGEHLNSTLNESSAKKEKEKNRRKFGNSINEKLAREPMGRIARETD